MHDSDGKKLQEELRLVERSGQGRPYPEALRRRVAAFGALRAGQGAAHHTIARELGIADRTLARWSAEAAVRFVPVEVVVAAAPQPSLVVHGPCGLRIEGLDGAQLAALLRSLS